MCSWHRWKQQGMWVSGWAGYLGSQAATGMSLWMSLQNYMLLLNFVYCRFKEEKGSLDNIHTLGCWDSRTFYSKLLVWFYFNYIESASFKDLIPERFQNSYLAFQLFRLSYSRCQLSNELSLQTVTERQMMPGSSTLTEPIFLFPFGPPERNSLPQFSCKQTKEDHHPSPLCWDGWFWLFYELYFVILRDTLQI